MSVKLKSDYPMVLKKKGQNLSIFVYSSRVEPVGVNRRRQLSKLPESSNLAVRIGYKTSRAIIIRRVNIYNTPLCTYLFSFDSYDVTHTNTSSHSHMFNLIQILLNKTYPLLLLLLWSQSFFLFLQWDSLLPPPILRRRTVIASIFTLYSPIIQIPTLNLKILTI